MNPEILTLWLSFTSVMLFSYWLVYCMGSPLADQPRDIDTGGIFFFVPLYLATRRLKQVDLLAAQRREYTSAMLNSDDPKTRQELTKMYRETIMILGRMFFTWERSLLCPICLHWWLTVLVMLLALIFGWSAFYIYPIQTIFVYLLNHLIIRKIA